MKTCTLGKTDLKVGELGLGTEYLNGQDRDTVVSVIRKAIDRGINYFDLIFSFPQYRDNLGAAFKGRRDKIILAGHIGCAETNGQYRNTRDVEECRTLFFDLLQRLDTDYVDVLFLQLVDEEDDYKKVMGPGGLFELAREMQSRKMTRYIGMSGHEAPVARKAVESGKIDVLMYPINLAWDSRPGRKELFRLCAQKSVGLVAMKPYAGGELLSGKSGNSLSPVHCINYALSQVGVCTAVPGVKNLAELESALRYLTSKDEEKDYSGLIFGFQRDIEGTCVYCNHCLPCPAGIDIGPTIRLLVSAGDGDAGIFRNQYEMLPVPASECVECGECSERCPFRVDVIAKMQQAVKTFE